MKHMYQTHKVAGVVMLITLVTFFVSTITIELLGDHEQIKWLKLLIMIFAIVLIVPLTIIIGKTGKKVSIGHNPKLLKKKSKLFKTIQRIGPFVLAPTGISLYFMARSDIFNAVFYTIQLIELIAQLTSIVLIIIAINTGIQLRKMKV